MKKVEAERCHQSLVAVVLLRCWSYSRGAAAEEGPTDRVSIVV